MFELILRVFWFILPAYFANSAPVVIGKLLGKYNLPIHKKLFGEGKTVPGFIGGVLVGTKVGFLQSLTSIEPRMTLQLAFLLSLGAMTGDLVKSFFKRRLGLKRGAPFPPADQLDFIIGALLFASLVVKIPLSYVITLLLLTPALHLATNVIAWKLALKKEWY